MALRRAACAAGVRFLGCALALAALAAALPARADDAFRGDADIAAGESLHAAFADGAAGPHRFTFFAAAGTSVAASLRSDRDASLVAAVSFAYPGGLRIEGRRADRAHLARFRAAYSGLYVLEVTPERGSGGYTLTTSARVAREVEGIFPAAPTGPESFAFDAGAGTRVTALVRPARRGPRILLTGLVAPGGETLPVLSVQDGPAASVRNHPIGVAGRYRLAWTNTGSPGELRVTFRFTGPPRAPLRNFGVADGVATRVVERGDPVLAPRDGYVGSAACGRCHGDLVRSWSDTAHNSAVRSWDRAGLSGRLMANDANGNGSDDFRDGLDLASTPAFAAFGASAPKLLFDADADVPYRVRIGDVTYTVDRTMGGNGLWRQRYLTKTGRTYRALPFEFDETTRTYAAFAPGDWYDAARRPTGRPPAAARSFEAQCSGCHGTGATLAADAGEFVTGYVEMNIGCEQCHGPGAAHAATGDVRKILNPRASLDGTAAGVGAANAICARCHTKGESKDPLPGTDVHAEFAYSAGRGVAQAGDAVADFLRASDDPADFWGAKSDPLPSVPGDTTLAARSDRHEGGDILAGVHAPSAEGTPACFDCHDPHSRAAAHQVAASVTREVRVATRADDNSLCLSCHAGERPFASITAQDAAAIRGTSGPASVARGVIDHMKDTGMPVREGLYDPLGTGVGRCTTCHMPRTPSAGAPSADREGYAAGNLASHRFETVSPRASVLYGVTNSCSVCHPVDAQDRAAPAIAQWAATPAAGTSFHAATPPASQDGIPLNRRVNPSKDGGVLCIQCHTSEGFRRVQVNPDAEAAPTQAEVDAVAKRAVARDHGVSCDACHGRRADGFFHGEDANPLRMPRDQLCAACHNDATVKFADFRDHGAVVRHPQREMLAGTAGDSPPGIPATATTAHTSLAGGCVACHFDRDSGAASHDFRPNVATCTSCHAGLVTFDRPAKADYDGDGFVRGIQTEVQGLLDRVKTALLLDARMSFAAGRFDIDGASDHALTGASAAQKRAVFNWYSVDDDGSRGVHDAARAVQLLQASWRELMGFDIPGATIR